MDEKETDTTVRPIAGKVLITFPEPILYLNISPVTAREFAAMLLACASAAASQPTTESNHESSKKSN